MESVMRGVLLCRNVITDCIIVRIEYLSDGGWQALAKWHIYQEEASVKHIYSIRELLRCEPRWVYPSYGCPCPGNVWPHRGTWVWPYGLGDGRGIP